jgi:hypothetical protein
VEPIAIDGLEKIGNEEAVEALISASNRLLANEAETVRASLKRIGARTSDASLKESITRSLNQTHP